MTDEKELIGKLIGENQIANGMHLCYMNANALASESRLLKENGHYARALSLVILALEELCKIPIILFAVILENKDSTVWSKYWKQFNSHKFKLRIWSQYGKPIPRFKGKGYEGLFPAGIERKVDKFKQLGFYVNFFKGDFVCPEDFAKDNSEWLESLAELTNEMIADFEPTCGSLESSKRSVGRGKDFVKTMGNNITREELKKAMSEWHSKQMGAANN